MNKEYKCYRCGKSFLRGNVYLWKQTHSPSSIQCMCRKCNTEKQRDYRENGGGKEAEKKASRRAYQNHKHKWQARAKVRYAVRTGKIDKPTKCEMCGLMKNLQGHHEDYSKPLEVRWLCAKHHAELHRPKHLLTPLTTK